MENSIEKFILVIDDEPFLRKLVVKIISRVVEEYHILEAKDGQEGVKLIEKYSPVLVITDFRMPIMNGLEVVRFIKNNHHPAKIIVLSGEEDRETDARLAGADRFMTKPFQAEALKREIKQLLGLE